MAAHPLVGLDIGSSSIRAAQTSRAKDGLAVTAYGAVALPPGAVTAGVVQDEAAVTEALRHLWTTSGFRTKKVVLGVTTPQVVVRKMTIADLPPAELRKSLPFQVRDSLPLPVERSLLDFHPLGKGEGGTVDGLLIASPKEAVLTAIRTIEKAGLHVSRVDLGSFALLRATAFLDANVEAIVDIGAQVTTVVMHADGVPIIIRTVPRGGAEITETVRTRLKLETLEAEERKRITGLVEETDPEVAAAVRDAVRPLVNEIRSSFAYLNTGDRSAQVARVLLSGGGALLPGLAELLGSQLNMQVGFANPLLRFNTGRRSVPDALRRTRGGAAVSIGLTIGAS